MKLADRHIAAGTLMSFGVVVLVGLDAAAAEKFQKLTGTQISSKLTGMEMTDGIHSADVFGRNGALTSYAMGKKKVGKWRVQKDQLCLDLGEGSSGCYDVWLAGQAIELRRQSADRLPLEGVLQKPIDRK